MAASSFRPTPIRRASARSSCCNPDDLPRGGTMNSTVFSTWQLWAVLSAIFAALTAIFAKVGVENVNSDLATLIRTIVVLVALALIVYATGQFQHPSEI